MSRRGVTILGLAVAGGAGYYLYNAGGDPKVAEKQMEADVHKASAKLKAEIPGRASEAEKKGEALASSAGSKLDQASAEARKKLEEAKREANNLSAKAGAKWDQASVDAQKKLEEAKREANSLSQKAGTEVNKAIDHFDKSVTEGAAKAKSGISSWFGGK